MEKFENKLLQTDDIYKTVKNITEETSDVDFSFDLKDKKNIFLLGLYFAGGKKIKNIDIEKLNLEELKSFDKMLYSWWKEDLQPNFEEENLEDGAFLIFPFRKANEEAKTMAGVLLNNIEKCGFNAYYPARDTNQEDYYSYRVGIDNANAISNARNIYLYYDRNSIGTIFDLGVAYYFQVKYPNRTFLVMKEEQIEWNENDFGDKVVLSMLNAQKVYNEERNTRKRNI